MIFNEEVVKAKQQEEALSIDQQLELLKAGKKKQDIEFSIQENMLNMQKLQSDTQQKAAKGVEKKNKIQADLVSNVIKNGSKGPVAIGGDLINQMIPEASPDSLGQPFIEG